MKRKLLFSAATLVLLVGVVIAYFYIDYQDFKLTPLDMTQPEIIQVNSGATFDDVKADLVARGLLQKPHYLKFLARETGQATRIKSGEYRLEPGITPTSLLDLLVSGKVVQYTLTLVEGWHLREIIAAIENDPILVKVLDYSQPGQLMQQLGYAAQSPEGLFFPDTYLFPRGTTDKAFLQRAHERLQTVLQQEWEQRAENLPYKTAYEALIMASIIEKETGLASERETIAGVFVRRLQKGMKLQTDPTVIYAMGEQFDGNIRKKDLNIDSPHNTYRYRGLPPTPIALAGREAIHAALHPEPGKALYFVAKGNGAHYFSETLEEHNRAVAKYQLKRN